MLEYLGVEETLKGFPNTDYISSAKIRQRIDSGLVTDIGQEMSMNLELLLALDPDMIMGYMVTGDFGQLAKIRQAGIPVVINAEYLEEHPLGRAEWIKFMGVLADREDTADSVFQMIESEYIATLQKVKRANAFPSIMSGIVYGDTWFLPGGQNYAARLIEDAGGNYLWKDDSASGFLEKSFESVYERAHDADFWVGVASYNSLQQLKEGDARYANFKAFQTGEVYSYNKRIGSKGGNEYLELGYLRPDLILKDLVYIFHPHLLKNHTLFFFNKLK
jgi:iron complex transport system substrate-binding protein